MMLRRGERTEIPPAEVMSPVATLPATQAAMTPQKAGGCDGGSRGSPATPPRPEGEPYNRVMRTAHNRICCLGYGGCAHNRDGVESG